MKIMSILLIEAELPEILNGYYEDDVQHKPGFTLVHKKMVSYLDNGSIQKTNLSSNNCIRLKASELLIITRGTYTSLRFYRARTRIHIREFVFLFSTAYD